MLVRGLLICALGLGVPRLARAEPSASCECASASVAKKPKVVDLNAATAADLEELPGVGPTKAQAILAFRDAHGGFRNVNQLMQIKGIGRSMFRRLRDHVTLGTAERKPPS